MSSGNDYLSGQHQGTDKIRLVMLKDNTTIIDTQKKYKVYTIISQVLSVVLLIILYLIFGCPIKLLTGVPCAGCGMTRALFASLKGDFNRAFYYHPLFWCVPLGFIIIVFRKKISKKMMSIIEGAAIVLFLSVYVYRLLNPTCHIVNADISEGLIYKLLKMFFETINGFW